MSHPDFLLPTILDHNPALLKALAAEIPDLTAVGDWLALCDALGDGKAGRVVAGFLGNKSERLMLAAILMKADYAALAVEVSPDFWRAWGGLDRRNKMMLLELLDEDLG